MNNRTYKYLICIISFFFILSINKCYAANTEKKYEVTDKITATLDKSGTLYVSGTGEMPDYGASSIPWKDETVKKVIVKSGITKIGKQDFASCDKLTQVEIASTVTEIGEGAFASCTSLNNISLPVSITKLGKGAFANCNNLSNISLNEGLIEIESYVFQSTKLKKVEIPSTLKKIGTDAFLNVTTIENFSVKGGNNETFYTDNGVLYNHVYDLQNNKYYNQRELVIYPTASKMSSYTILSGTTSINQRAFKNALNLKQVKIPDSIQGIGADSFNNTGLTSITIPKVTLTYFGPDIFRNNKYLETVDFKADLKLWIFYDAKYLQGGTFQDCTALKKVTFSGDIEEFGANAFKGCTSLTQITLPNKLKEISYYCFQDCTSLENMTFPNKLESIRDCAFKNCTRLKQVVFPSSLVEIKKSAFDNCTKVTKKFPDGFELKSDNYYRKTFFVTISGTYDYDKAYEVFQLVNKERKAEGLNELKFDVDISNAAMERSAELSLYLSHTRPDMSDCGTVLKDIRSGDLMQGENIAAGQTTAEYAMNGWMNSAGHKANIMSKNYNTIGIGCYKDSYGNLYWTQIFVTGNPTNTNTSGFKGTKAITKKREIAPNIFDITLKNVPTSAYVEGTANIHLGILNADWPGRFTYAENSEVSYKVKDTSICKIENGENSNTMKLTFLKPGTTEISATLNGKKVTETITVKEKRIPLQSIMINKQSVTLEVGEKVKLNVIYTPENTNDNKNVTWSPYDKSIATVDDKGYITGIKEGNSCVWAKVGNHTATCYITVKEWSQFKDVKSSDWFYEAVKYTYKNNIIKGYNDTIFAPNDKLTRGMIVTILYRMEGSPNNNGISRFNDVNPKEYYAKAIKWAVDNGIVHGYGGTNKFGPDDNILRQDLAGILCNYAKYKKKNTNITTDLSKFKDYKKIESYAKAAMQWAVGKGVITGNADGTLNPKGNATRAEAAAMIQKYCNKVGR